jgi:L-asparaginase/Glu-tRNA(Gln) amidotransferase subunit D
LADIAEIRVVAHSNINSALMDTATAFGLRNTLRDMLLDEAVAGLVVTHGTVTLEEIAYLMDLRRGVGNPTPHREYRPSRRRGQLTLTLQELMDE